jgi:hypothetical protein
MLPMLLTSVDSGLHDVDFVVAWTQIYTPCSIPTCDQKLCPKRTPQPPTCRLIIALTMRPHNTALNDTLHVTQADVYGKTRIILQNFD